MHFCNNLQENIKNFNLMNSKVCKVTEIHIRNIYFSGAFCTIVSLCAGCWVLKMLLKTSLSQNIPFFSNLLNKRAEYIFRCKFFFVKLLLKERYAMINVTPRSLHWLLRTLLLYEYAAAISRVFSETKFF